MFGSQVLEVAIGLVLLYLLLSLICSSIREGIEAWQKARAVDLERGIRELLHDRDGRGLAQALYNHPFVYSLFKGEYDPAKITKDRMPSGSNLPSYIPARNFAVALMDIVARGPSVAPSAANAGAGAAGGEGAAHAITTRMSLESLRSAVGTLNNAPVQRALLTAIDTAQGDLGRAQANMEAWFNSSMDRVSGWYKRRTQTIIFVVGAILTIVVNADTLTVAESLVQDDALRKAVVAEAEAISRDKDRSAADVQTRYHDLTAMGFPIGWTRTLPARSEECNASCVAWSVARDIPGHIPGWLITAFAISLGAPFWFDMLNRFMVIRSTVKPHEKSPEEASEDRQSPVARQAGGNGWRASPPGLAPTNASGAPSRSHEWAHGDPQEGVL